MQEGPPSPTDSKPVNKAVNELVRPRWSHLEYRWRLENFWELRALACVEALEDENGGLIWSQRFGDKERGLWQLKLYPYGDLSPAGRGHVSLFLSLDLKSLEVPKAYAIFGCYLLDEDGSKVANSGRSFTRQKFAEGSSSWGWSQFIKVEGQSLNRLLRSPGECLIIKCEIEVFVGIFSSPGKNFAKPKSFEEEIRLFLCNPNSYDVQIISQDLKTIRASSIVLRSRSKWFSRKLNSQTQSKEIANETEKIDAPSSITYASFGAFDKSFDRPFEPRADPRVESPGDSEPGNDENSLKDQNLTASAINTPINTTVQCSFVNFEILENVVTFLHTDDCRYFAEGAGLTAMLELFQAAHALEIESLTTLMIRKLSAMVVSRSTALAIQEVSRKLGVRELAEACQTYLLMCVRDLSDEEILKALVPKR